MKIWDKDSERGALLGAIGAIVLFTFVFPDPDVDLGVTFPGNPPYGLLWYLLNPFYWTKKLYPMIIFVEWAGVTSLEWWLAKKGFLNSGLVKLQIFSVAVLLMLHATQDVTVIMFAPLIMLTPGFVSFEILQKIPLPGTPQWDCAFHGVGTDANAYLYPCLSNTTNVERGGEEKKYSVTPTIRKQPSPSPTKSLSRLDVLLLLTLGVCAHDVASIQGFHIPGYHAIYFAAPMVGVILSIKFERRIKKWKSKRKFKQ